MVLSSCVLVWGVLIKEFGKAIRRRAPRRGEAGALRDLMRPRVKCELKYQIMRSCGTGPVNYLDSYPSPLDQVSYIEFSSNLG